MKRTSALAFLPVNLLFAAIFLFGVAWGWDGEAERQFFAVLSSIFMFPLWLLPLYNLTETSPGIVAIAIVRGWLPTALIVNMLWWNVVLMYFTAAHFMESLNREEPLGRMMKRMRKPLK